MRRNLAVLLCAWSVGCARASEGEVSAELVMIRDRAADLGARERWEEACTLLAPVVEQENAALEDILRAANARLAIKDRTDNAELARPLIERAEGLAPDDPRVLWCRYRLAATDFDLPTAVATLRRLAQAEPANPTVELALASNLDLLDEPESKREAQSLYRAFLARPSETTGNWRMTALYKLSQALFRQDQVEEGQQLLDEMTRLEASGVTRPGDPQHEPDTLGAVPPHTPGLFELPAPAPRAVRLELAVLAPPGAFHGVLSSQLVFSARPDAYSGQEASTEEVFPFESRASVITFGSQGAAWVGPDGLRTLVDASVVDAAPFDRMNHGVDRSSDAEKERKRGDRDLDLLVAGSDGNLRLLENADGSWSPLGEPLASPGVLPGPDRLTPVDFDHDGDVDLLVTTAERPLLLRNDGLDGTGGFADAGPDAGLPAGDFRALTEDFDRDNDVDLLLVDRARGTARLLSNLRGGRFGEESAGLPAGLSGQWFVAADFDGDSWVDLAVFGSDLTLHTRTALGGWNEARRFALPEPPTGEPSAVDWDLDGSFDLVWPCAARAAAAILAPGFANGGVAAPLGEAFAAPEASSATLRVVDLDGDHDLDLLRLDGVGLRAFHAAGAGSGTTLALLGHKDNARGIGAVVELRSGLLYRRLYYRGDPVLAGFGEQPIEEVRVTWPRGVVQANFGFPPRSARLVAQRLGQLGSCPFLYTWNGTTYEFVSDVLGITPLGLPMAPGMLVPPDHDEFVLIRGEQLVPRDGSYELQLTEELREVTYLDEARLIVVDHPAGVEVFPNERFTFPPFPEAHTHTVRDPLVPLSAVDQEGRDWTRELARDDREFAIPFELVPGPYQGLATPHVLELAFDAEQVRSAPKLRLFLAGWLYWTDASVNVAAARHPDFEFVPPLLSVPDGNGGWKDCGPIGFPAGKLKTMAVDVGAFVNRVDPRLRLTSTLRLYWDSIRLAVDGDDAPLVTTELRPSSARLWQRGFSRMTPLLGEHECEWFVWDELADFPRWNQHPGLYTRLGETLPLLERSDDRFVVFGAGDALTLRFEAARVPPLAEGSERDYLLYLDGWAKDRDPNTLEALYVEPLPFHGMSGYPYGPDERYPDDEEHRAYRAEWNTRPATRWVEPLAPRRAASIARDVVRAAPAASAGE